MNCIIDNEIDISDDDIDYKSHMVVNKFNTNKLDINVFYKIDAKNIFIQDNLDEMEQKLNGVFGENNNYTENKNNIQEELINILCKKFYMNSGSDPFTISKNISNEFFKFHKFSKDKLEESINFFYNKLQSIKDSKLFIFNKSNISYMGYILASSYYKFKEYKITDNKSLKKSINGSIKDKTDVIENYNNYNKKNKRKTKTQKKIVYWENNSYNYFLPGIFIFLMNILKNKTTIEIEIDALSNIEEKLNFFIMCLINLEYILPKQANHIKLNLINKRLQYNLYSKYYFDLINNIEKLHGDIKKFFIKNNLNKKNSDIYQQKWDFETEFLIGENQQIDFNSKGVKKIDKINDINNNINNKNKLRNSDYNHLNYLRFKKSNKYTKFTNDCDLSVSVNNITSDQISNDDSLNDATTNQSSQNISINKNLNKSKQEIKKSKTFKLWSLFQIKKVKKQSQQSPKCCEDLSLNYGVIQEINDDNGNLDLNPFNNIYKNNNKKYNEIINENINIFSAIFIAMNTIKNINSYNSINLVMNDSYSPEYVNILQNEIKYNGINNDDSNKKNNERNNNSPKLLNSINFFNLIDIISDQLMGYNSINLEINILDYTTFSKILYLLSKNKNLETLNFSFFSSDITYFSPSLYKIFINIIKKSLNHYYFMDDVEYKLLDLLFPKYMVSLQHLFYVIMYKKVKNIGLKFDIPFILINYKKYILPILKLIINIILLITKSDNKTEKLILLSPLLKFDGRCYPFINEIFDELKINKLKEISFHVKLYKIINIKNLISESLIILNLGDCDIFTFENLVNYLVSYKFCLKSKLRKVSISLMKIYTKLNMLLFELIYKIFSIKIRQLIKMNIYTNLIIDSKEYSDFLNIFRNNWISSVKLVLNPKSKCNYDYPFGETSNKIFFLVPYCLEDYLLTNDENTNKIIEDDNLNKNDDIFFLLYYLFKKKYCVSSINNNSNKNNIEFNYRDYPKELSNNILKYLHLNKEIQISYK